MHSLLVFADKHWLISCLQDKRIFLDLNSESEENVSNLVEWLNCVTKARIATFLNKKVDAVITNRDNKRGKGLNSFHKHQYKRRSLRMLGMASTAECGGSSSVFDISTKWNMTVVKYADVLSTMTKFQFAPKQTCSQTVSRAKNSGKVHVRSLGSAFVKVEDQSRKFRPEFAEMTSFPFIDFNTEGTGSAFDMWYRENCSYSQKKKTS